MPNLSTLSLPSGPSIPVNGVDLKKKLQPKALTLSQTGRVNLTDAAKAQTQAEIDEKNLKFTVSELGQQLKTERPDLFGTYSDEEVGNKMLERKPELAKYVVEPEKKSGFIANLLKGMANTPLRLLAGPAQLLTGLKTVDNPNADKYGIGKEGEWEGSQVNAGMDLPFFGNIQPIGYDQNGKMKTPSGIAKDVLGSAMEMGSYALGGFGATGLAEGMGKTAIKELALQGAKEGALVGGMGSLGSTMQDENATAGDMLKNTVMGAGLGAGMGLAFPLASAGAVKSSEVGGSALKKVFNKVRNQSFAGEKIIPGVDKATGNILEKAGKKIQETVIKPSKKDIQGGFRIDNVEKYDLGGNLQTSFEKTQQRLNEYTAQLKKLIDEGGDAQVVNLGKLVDDLDAKYQNKGLSGLGSQRETANTIESIKKELDSIKPNWREENITLSDAIQAKRAVGSFTAFLHDPIKAGTSATEDVWNDFYMLLKNETERVAPPGLREVNKAISEIIPIQQAIIRRIPVADRNNVLGLADILGGVGMFANPASILLPLMNRLLKSGTFADILMKLGKKYAPLPRKQITLGVTEGSKALESVKLKPRSLSTKLRKVEPLSAKDLGNMLKKSLPVNLGRNATIGNEKGF